MKVYQVEASKLHASAVLNVTAESLFEANKVLTAMIKALGMQPESLIGEL